jgi:GDP-L-fucose synthase
MRKTRVLLTGGGGMVGRNLLEHAEIRRYEVLAPPRSELDLCDFAAVQRYLAEFQPVLVVHAAGKVGGIQANLRDPVHFLVDNLDMGRNVVLASFQAGVKQLVNLGSSCMYPRNHSEPLREDMVLKGELEPSNEGYALAKVVTARLCEYIMREDASCHFKTIIPCNLYGRHDKFDPAQSHLVPAIIHKIHQAQKSGQQVVEIWGNGTARREFMYAGDLADAMIRAMDNVAGLPACMNIGLGHDSTINEYYQAVGDVLGYSGRFVHDLDKPVGMARKLVSVERQRVWGWAAQHSLREGIVKTYDYYLKECRP